MYEKLTAVAPLMEKLSATLSAPDASVRVASITAALDEAANQISDAAQSVAAAEERVSLQKIYRGMVAAKRIVAQLHELSPVCEAGEVRL
jgi:hypothetical protein